jgi:hypothetical protein
MNSPTVSVTQIEQALHRLPSQRLQDVLLFIEFLEHLEENVPDEDRALWKAVEFHRAYQEEHPGDEPEVFDTAEAFLKASEDW